jgi:hypothetical protein
MTEKPPNLKDLRSLDSILETKDNYIIWDDSTIFLNLRKEKILISAMKLIY